MCFILDIFVASVIQCVSYDLCSKCECSEELGRVSARIAGEPLGVNVRDDKPRGRYRDQPAHARGYGFAGFVFAPLRSRA